MAPTPEPSHPQRILDTLAGYQASAALHAAIDLDLFTAIGSGCHEVESLAKATACAPRGIRILADYLVARGFLAKDAERYSLPPGTAALLDRRSPSYIGGVARFLADGELPALFRSTKDAVRLGATADPAGGLAAATSDAWLRFAEGFAPLSQRLASDVAAWIDERGWGRGSVLDLGAGSGAYGIEIARRVKGATVVAVDRADVLALASARAREAGVDARWRAIPGDVADADGTGPHELVVAAHFLHHFSEAQCVEILRRCAAALRPGGVMLIVDAPPDEGRTAPADAAAFALVMLVATPGGDAWRVSDYARMARAAGLGDLQSHALDAGPRRMMWTKRA